ncbi:MAG: HD domain-containing phosphohydrolase [Chitinivibrionales bacterium]
MGDSNDRASLSGHFKITTVVMLLALIVFKAINTWRFPNEEIIPDSVTLVVTIVLLVYLWIHELIDRDRLYAMNIKLAASREKMKQTQISSLQTLISALEMKHPHFRGHGRRVTMLSEGIAQRLKLPTDEIELIRTAAQLHDIGIIRVMDDVFDKKDNLSESQWADIKLHPAVSSEILSSAEFLQQESVIVRGHHERFDGKGYPDALRGEGISMGGRIIAVADAFDAMNSSRSYRPLPLSQQFIIRELRANAGQQFDPKVVSALLELLNEKPQVWSSA